jgi:hypothetical protein
MSEISRVAVTVKGGPPGALWVEQTSRAVGRLCVPPCPRWSSRQSRAAQPLTNAVRA